MAPKPRCPVCRSKKWHRDQLSGSIVCEEGHLLQGYVHESNEAQGTSQHVTTRRNIYKTRRSKRDTSKLTKNLHFHGQRSDFLLFQCLQWVLRKELNVLIEQLGWPVELEGVVRDLWILVMSEKGVPDAVGDWYQNLEPINSFMGPRTGMVGPRKKKRKKNQLGNMDDQDDETEDEDEAEQRQRSQQHRRREGSQGSTTTTSSLSESDPDDDDFELFGQDDRPRSKRSRTTRASSASTARERSEAMARKHTYKDPRATVSIDLLLLIIYLACATIRFPILLKDLFDLAQSHRILYINASRYLPSAMQTHLDRDARRILSPTNVPNLTDKAVQSLLSHLIHLYESSHSLHFPLPSIPPLLWRLCKSLALSPQFYTDTFKLVGESEVGFELAGKVRRKGFKTGVAKARGLNGLPEGLLAAFMVITWKMRYDDEETSGEWARTVQRLDEIRESGKESRLWTKEVTSLSSNDIDDYLSFFERNILAEQSVPKRATELSRFFKMEISSSSHPVIPAASTSETNQVLASLYSTKPNPSPNLPATSTSEKPYFRHGIDPYTSLPSSLSKFVETLSSLIGHSPLQLSTIVTRLEKHLDSLYSPSSSSRYSEKIRSKAINKKEALRRRKVVWDDEVERRKALNEFVKKRIGMRRAKGRGVVGKLVVKSEEFIDDEDEEDGDEQDEVEEPRDDEGEDEGESESEK